MLSKLRHANVNGKRLSLNKKSLLASLHALFMGDLVDIQPLPGGTLGTCFVGVLSGQRRIFKTHLVRAGKQTLEREAIFLNAVAGVRVDACLVHAATEVADRTWLHMKMLHQSDVLTPLAVLKLIADYEAALHAFPQANLVPQEDNLNLLLAEAEAGLDLLAGMRLLLFDVQRHIRRSLNRIRSNCDAWPRQLCHGDLGPANIMADEQGPLAIDWEDAFWGVAGYDYLCWLTFFNNRPLLSRDALGHTPLGKANEVDLMVMILLLKSVLSVRNRSYLCNSISFDQRLLEVISLG